MKNENLNDYQLFYMEIPQADYLNDIEIQDEYDANNYDEIQGLSAEQVSKIARDSLDSAPEQLPSLSADSNPNLFTDSNPAQ